jgi:hypothetical protein
MMQPIALEEFLKRTGFSQQELLFLHAPSITHVISLRDMKHIETVMVMPRPYLERLLSCIGLVGAPNIKVYEKCSIRLMRIDPSQLYLGQRYVYRKKYTSIMENFRDLFREFSITRGISKLTALIVLGKDKDKNHSLAHYLPPIIEAHANKTIIMDGVNRNFIIRNSGTTIESIVVEDVNVTFPCVVRPWDDISVIDDKPEREEDRYFDFRPSLFRDLKSVGIDG